MYYNDCGVSSGVGAVSTGLSAAGGPGPYMGIPSPPWLVAPSAGSRASLATPGQATTRQVTATRGFPDVGQ